MRLYQLVIPTILLAATACNKRITVNGPTGFSINVNNQRSISGDTLYFNLGDTVKFTMNGNVDNITFYSGEPGHQYAFAQRTSVSKAIPQMSFTSATNQSTQANTLKILAINQLNINDSAAVVTAPWTDITSRAQLAVDAAAVNSGIIDLSDLASGANDSLFVAFRYSGVTGSLQRTWTITGLNIYSLLPDSTSNTLLTLSSSANYWKVLGNIWNPANAKWTPSATQLQVSGGNQAAPADTSWIISPPLYVGAVNPDKPVVVKFTSSALPAYTVAGVTYYGYNYVYNSPGLYKATFVYFNQSIDDRKAMVRDYYIRIN